MGQIHTTSVTIQMEDHVDATIYMTKDDSQPIEIQVLIMVDGYPVNWGWGRTSEKVFESGRFREEWKVLRAFLKSEYFQQIETTINQWRNQNQ